MRTLPTYAEGTQLPDLQTPEQLLTVALRLFAAEWSRVPTEHNWREGFASAGLARFGLPAFERLFRTVASAPRRPLDVRCMHCAELGADEGLFLQLIAHLQRRRFGEARDILAAWIPPASIRIAMPAARELALAMTDRGLFVPPRHGRAMTLVPQSSQTHAGSALLH
jgi:hypothetical protein